MSFRAYLLPEASEIEISQNFNAESLTLLQIRKPDTVEHIWLEGYRNPMTCVSSLGGLKIKMTEQV